VPSLLSERSRLVKALLSEDILGMSVSYQEGIKDIGSS
jgi:hypothetical protein